MIRDKQIKEKQCLLACDPSLTAWGFSVITADGIVLDADCIVTKSEAKSRRIRKGDDRVRRTQEINTTLLSLIKKYNIRYIVSELPHGSKSAAAAVMIGIVIGVLQTLSDTLNIGLEWYSEGDAKKEILGKRSATKDEMIAAIKKRYTVPWRNAGFRDEAIADSMAIFHLASKTSPAIKLFFK